MINNSIIKKIKKNRDKGPTSPKIKHGRTRVCTGQNRSIPTVYLHSALDENSGSKNSPVRMFTTVHFDSSRFHGRCQLVLPVIQMLYRDTKLRNWLFCRELMFFVKTWYVPISTLRWHATFALMKGCEAHLTTYRKGWKPWGGHPSPSPTGLRARVWAIWWD